MACAQHRSYVVLRMPRADMDTLPRSCDEHVLAHLVGVVRGELI